MNIKAIIFDIGGVIVNDHALRDSTIEALGITDKQAFWEAMNEAALPACRGEEPLMDIWKSIGRELGINVSNSLASTLWSKEYEERIVIDSEVLSLVDELRKTFRTAVISNTIEEHASVLRRLGVYDHFDHITLSHEVRATKDTATIFHSCLEALQLEAHETVFIDDVERFRKTAQDLGMTALLFHSVDNLRKDLVKFGLLPNT